MEFRLLGPFEAWQNGTRVELGDLQQRYVLVVLLLHANRPVSTDRLTDIVWTGQQAPKTPLVPGYIAKLRKTFRDAGADDVAIDTTPTGYLLRLDGERLDTDRFGRLTAAATDARENGRPERAVELLCEAIGLWRGRFLEDIDIDRVGGAEVVVPDDAYLDALGDLAELELLAGNHRWVRDRLRSPVHVDPTRQRLAALLMRALLANGDRVQAVELYHKCAAALDEYGLEPSVDLRDLARLAQVRENRSALPERPARFTGRTAELALIESGSEQPGCGAVWISGMPGVGKTALAVQAAYRLRSRFPDAQVFVSLNGFTPDTASTEVGDALYALLCDLGVPPERVPPTTAGRLDLYHARLDGTRTLVVLDNAASEEQVRRLLPTSEGCLAVVTSRLAGDLDTAANVRLEPLRPDEAAELFRHLVGPERLRGKATLVDEVVARCGWVPLQIRVVASQFRRHPSWPLEYLVDLLAEAGPWGGEFDDAGTVACLVSYRQLSEPQQTLFRLLGSAPGTDLSVPGAAALIGRDLPGARALLDDLHGLSLLEEAVPARYHLLDPLREFATSVLPLSISDSSTAVERLLDYYLASTAAAVAAMFPFDVERQPVVRRESPLVQTFTDAAARNWLSAERLNLVAAIRYAAGLGIEHTWQLSVLLWRYFYVTGHLKDWVETLELARTATSANRTGLAHVLLRLSGAHWCSGELTAALELATKALPLWVELDDPRGEGDTLCAIASATLGLGDYEQAMWSFHAALAKYERIGDRQGQASALSNLGHLNELHANLGLAEQQHLSSTTLLRELEQLPGLVHALDNLGCVRRRLGRLDEALRDHEEARRLAVEIGDRSGEAYALNNLGNVHRHAGRLDDALRQHDLAGRIADAVADPHLRTQIALDRAATHLARDENLAALKDFRGAMELAEATGDRIQQAHANLGIARILHGTGRHNQAARHWRAAVVGFGETRQPEAGEVRREREQLGCDCAVDRER